MPQTRYQLRKRAGGRLEDAVDSLQLARNRPKKRARVEQDEHDHAGRTRKRKVNVVEPTESEVVHAGGGKGGGMKETSALELHISTSQPESFAWPKREPSASPVIALPLPEAAMSPASANKGRVSQDVVMSPAPGTGRPFVKTPKSATLTESRLNTEGSSVKETPKSAEAGKCSMTWLPPSVVKSPKSAEAIMLTHGTDMGSVSGTLKSARAGESIKSGIPESSAQATKSAEEGAVESPVDTSVLVIEAPKSAPEGMRSFDAGLSASIKTPMSADAAKLPQRAMDVVSAKTLKSAEEAIQSWSVEKTASAVTKPAPTEATSVVSSCPGHHDPGPMSEAPTMDKSPTPMMTSTTACHHRTDNPASSTGFGESFIPGLSSVPVPQTVPTLTTSDLSRLNSVFMIPGPPEQG